MCGLTIIVNQKNLQADKAILKKWIISLSIEVQTERVFFVDHNLVLAHRWLTIIDLDSRSNQPMTGPDDFVITYNGEIYNYIELKKELKSLGYTFKTESDKEVLLMVYHCWGKQCLE